MYRVTLWRTTDGRNRPLDPEDWTKRQETASPTYAEAQSQADFLLGLLTDNPDDITITSPNGYDLEVFPMGRKKQTSEPALPLTGAHDYVHRPPETVNVAPVPQPAPGPATSSPPPSVADICRAAVRAGQEKAGDALNWAKINYPGLPVNEATFKATYSKVKNEGKTGDSAVIRSPRPQTPVAPLFDRHADNSDPSLRDLLNVERLAEENHIPLADLLSQVQQVHDLVSEVGSLDKLLKCAEALHRWTNK